MKGYVKVKKELIEQALRNVQADINEGEILIDKGIALYYQKNFVNRGKLFKWWNRKYEGKPESFVKACIPMLKGWTSVLCEVLSKDEIKSINKRMFGLESALKSLLIESVDDVVLLDVEFCYNVKAYTENYDK